MSMAAMAAGEMALLLTTCRTPPTNASFPLSGIGRKPSSFVGYRIRAPFGLKEKRVSQLIVVKASADVDGTGPDPAKPPTPTPTEKSSEEENVGVENLPLESKLQLKLEQKLRMKLAKKIRLRRKRLVRKRHLRKKGRWPPSKMKKNKNV